MPDNPKWANILAVIPEPFHASVKPVLEEWDRGIQTEFDKRAKDLEKFKEYEDIVDLGIDPEWIKNAIQFGQDFENNPADIVKRANEAFSLGYVPKDEVAALQQSANNGFGDPDDLGLGDMGNTDITNHPQFKALMEAVSGIQGSLQSDREERERQAQMSEHEKFLGRMHERHGDFDDDIVSSLMGSGMAFNKALGKYNSLIAGQVPTPDGDTGDGSNNNQAGDGTDAPVVMGGAGTGSGQPQEPINFGEMKTGDLESVVEQYLNAANASD